MASISVIERSGSLAGFAVHHSVMVDGRVVRKIRTFLVKRYDSLDACWAAVFAFKCRAKVAEDAAAHSRTGLARGRAVYRGNGLPIDVAGISFYFSRSIGSLILSVSLSGEKKAKHFSVVPHRFDYEKWFLPKMKMALTMLAESKGLSSAPDEWLDRIPDKGTVERYVIDQDR